MENLSSTSPPRPQLVTWISLGVLIFSGWQWSSVLTAMSVPDLPLTLPKSLLIIRPAAYGFFSLVVSAGLYFGRAWAPMLAIAITAAIMIWSSMERLIFGTSEYGLRTLWGTIAFSLMVLILWIIVLRQPKIRAYFQENPV